MNEKMNEETFLKYLAEYVQKNDEKKNGEFLMKIVNLFSPQ